jgi:hypothetical protein
MGSEKNHQNPKSIWGCCLCSKRTYRAFWVGMSPSAQQFYNLETDLTSGNFITGAKQLYKYWESYWDYCQDKVDSNPTSNQGSLCSKFTGVTTITLLSPLWWPFFGKFDILYCSNIVVFHLQHQIPFDLSYGFECLKKN